MTTSLEIATALTLKMLLLRLGYRGVEDGAGYFTAMLVLCFGARLSDKMGLRSPQELCLPTITHFPLCWALTGLGSHSPLEPVSFSKKYKKYHNKREEFSVFGV
jgi:hypothetical protein